MATSNVIRLDDYRPDPDGPYFTIECGEHVHVIPAEYFRRMVRGEKVLEILCVTRWLVQGFLDQQQMDCIVSDTTPDGA